MTGKELFSKLSFRDFSGSETDEYAQLLMTIYGNIGDAIFPLLEKAEQLNLKLSLKDDGAEEIMASDVVLV